MKENQTQGGSWEKWKLGLWENPKSNKCGAMQANIERGNFEKEP
jgi:hypothetical protein